jgi:site-specific recombinase XerD
VSEGNTPPPSLGENELDRFAEHLRQDRGLAANTVLAQTHRVRHFLAFLKFDAKAFQLSRLELERGRGQALVWGVFGFTKW